MQKMVTRKSRKGSLSLEAVLVLPVILLLLISFLGMQSAITAEIKLKGALDRTAAELALLSPLAQAIGPILAESDERSVDGDEGSRVDDASSVDGVQSEPADGTTLIDDLEQVVGEIIPGFSLEELARDFLLDATSTAVLGQILQQRIEYWLLETGTGQSTDSGLAASQWEKHLVNRRIYLDWRVAQRQLWLCLSYRLSTPLGWTDRQIRSIVPLWFDDLDVIKASNGELADGAVWLLDNFSRGQIIRREMGGDLPYDFPVIARFAGGEAIMIKSLDLTAPGYQQMGALLDQTGSYLDALAGFAGATYERADKVVVVEPDEIASRRLILVVPGNASQSWLSDAWSELNRQAFSKGVVLQIVTHGDSTRYAPQAAASLVS